MKRLIGTKRCDAYPCPGRTLWSDRGGSSAVEFAIILPVLILLMFGTVQYALLFFSYNGMINGAREASRVLAVGAGDATAAQARALATLPSWVGDANWTVTAVDAARGSPVRTTITVDSAKASILAFAPMPATLSVVVAMRKEG